MIIMKKVDIPMVERKDNNKSNIDKLIDSANYYLSKDDKLIFNEESIRDCIFQNDNNISNIDVSKFFNQIQYKNNLTKEELIYIYDIYNIRWLCDMYSKFDFDGNYWKEYVHPYQDYETGVWRYDISDRYEYNSVLNIVSSMIDARSNFAKIFNCPVDRVARNQEELDSNPEYYVCLLGDLNTWDKKKVYYPNLKFVSKNVYGNRLYETTGLNNLEFIGGNAHFDYLYHVDGLQNLIAVGGDLYLSNILDASNLSSLMSVKGNLSLRNCLESSSFGLYNLMYIGGLADFDSLEGKDCLPNLRMIGKYGEFSSKEFVDNLPNLKYAGEGINVGYQKVKTKVRTKTK